MGSMVVGNTLPEDCTNASEMNSKPNKILQYKHETFPLGAELESLNEFSLYLALENCKTQ